MSNPRHILVVDDDADLRRMVTEYLNDYELRVTGATDGAAMRHALAREVVDLILLDLNMPGMDGKQVLEKIKGDTAFKNIPVIVLTTSADNIDVERCYSLGASTYIQKPVSFDGLTAAVRTMKNYWCGIALLPSKREE